MNEGASVLGDTIARGRRLFGASTAPWAEALHEMSEYSWSAFSGVASPDYNLTLVHGGDVGDEVTSALQRVRDAAVPSIVMLAGEGLAGAQRLSDAGWVNIGSMPFMIREHSGRRPDPAVRALTESDLPAARELARGAFGVADGPASLIFSPRVLHRTDSLMAGLFDGGVLVSCLLICTAPGASTGWALATAPDRRRGGQATRLIAGALELDFLDRGESTNYCLSSPMATRLYSSLGFETIEHWQTWSRPRWIMGAS